MSTASEAEACLRRHLDSVFNNDVAEYRATTGEDLALYERCFTPAATGVRVDGANFADRGAVHMASGLVRAS